MELTPVTPDIAGQVGAPRGTHGLVVTSVDPGSLAADAGIREGDIVQQVNRQPIRTAADVSAALAKSKDRPALLQILREGRSLFIAVSVA
jgi:serine protease Do